MVVVCCMGALVGWWFGVLVWRCQCMCVAWVGCCPMVCVGVLVVWRFVVCGVVCWCWWCVAGVLDPCVLCVGELAWWCQCMCVPEGLLPPWWVGGVGVLVVCCLGVALHRCGLVVWGGAPLFIIRIHNYSKKFEHAQTAQNVWTPIGMPITKRKHTGVSPGACPLCGLACLCVGGLCHAWPHPISGLMVL